MTDIRNTSNVPIANPFRMLPHPSPRRSAHELRRAPPGFSGGRSQILPARNPLDRVWRYPVYAERGPTVSGRRGPAHGRIEAFLEVEPMEHPGISPSLLAWE